MGERPAELDKIFQKYLPNSPHFEETDKFGLKRKQLKNFQEKTDHDISPIYRHIIESAQLFQLNSQLNSQFNSQLNSQLNSQQLSLEKYHNPLDEVTIIIDEEEEPDKLEEITITDVCSIEKRSPKKLFKCLLCSAKFARKQDHISHHLKDHVSNMCDEIYMAGSAEILFM